MRNSEKTVAQMCAERPDTFKLRGKRKPPSITLEAWLALQPPVARKTFSLPAGTVCVRAGVEFKLMTATLIEVEEDGWPLIFSSLPARFRRAAA